MERAIVPTIMLAIVLIAGCGGESSNDPPSAVLVLEPDTAVILDNENTDDFPTIDFYGNESTDDDGIANYHFDFGNGEYKDSQSSSESREYQLAGFYEVFLEVEDDDGKTDRDEEDLIINYEARRSGVVVNETTGGNPEETEIYNVSSFNPYNGTFIIYADEVSSMTSGTTDVTIKLFNSTDEELYRYDWNDVEEGTNWTHQLDDDFLNKWEYGDYIVEIESKQGTLSYSIEVFIFYRD